MKAGVTAARVGLPIDYLDEQGGFDENILPTVQLVAYDFRDRAGMPAGRHCHHRFGLGIIGMNDALSDLGWMPPLYTTTVFEFAGTSPWWSQQLAGWVGLDQYDERNPVARDSRQGENDVDRHH